MTLPVWPTVRQLLSPSSLFEKYGTASLAELQLELWWWGSAFLSIFWNEDTSVSAYYNRVHALWSRSPILGVTGLQLLLLLTIGVNSSTQPVKPVVLSRCEWGYVRVTDINLLSDWVGIRFVSKRCWIRVCIQDFPIAISLGRVSFVTSSEKLIHTVNQQRPEKCGHGAVSFPAREVRHGRAPCP
jgi:hypothetical protein